MTRPAISPELEEAVRKGGLHLVHDRPPEPQLCQIIKGGLFDNQPEWECGEPAEFRSLLDGWTMCAACAESMPYLWPERMN